MKSHYLYARLTHKYITAYADMDDHEYLGVAKILAPTHAAYDEEGTSHTEWNHVVLSKATMEKARKVWRQSAGKKGHKPHFLTWLENQVGGIFASGCGCEHDCCAHWQSYGQAELIRGGHFKVAVRSYMNI